VHGQDLLLLVAGAVAVAGVARRLNWSAPLLLVVAGLAASFLPGMSQFTLDPDLVLYFVLPPLLFAAAWESSFVNLRNNLRPVLLLSVGLVLFTVLAVGLVAHVAIGGLPLAAAFALGAVVAPPDAVAATSVGRAVGLPRRLVVILAGVSLFNDATALTAYRVAVAAAVSGTFSTISLVASSPSMPGMRTSMITTWGRRRSTSATAPAPSEASPITRTCGARESERRSPSRTTSWSSTIRQVISSGIAAQVYCGSRLSDTQRELNRLRRRRQRLLPPVADAVLAGEGAHPVADRIDLGRG